VGEEVSVPTLRTSVPEGVQTFMLIIHTINDPLPNMPIYSYWLSWRFSCTRL